MPPLTPTYPTSVDTQTTLGQYANNAETTLSGALDATATTVPVASTTLFPASGVISIDAEIISYASKDATNFLTCVRGVDGSAAATHSSGAVVKGRIVAGHLAALRDPILLLETYMGTRSAPAQSGAGRMDNAQALTWRNAANDGDVPGWRVNSSNYLDWGTQARYVTGAGTQIYYDEQGTYSTTYIKSAMTIKRQFTTVPTAGYRDACLTLMANCIQSGTVSEGRNALYVEARDRNQVVNKTISAMSRSGTTVTVTATAHTFATGDKISIYGTVHTFNAEVNGVWIIANATTNTFDITVAGLSSGSYTSGGTATNRGLFYAVVAAAVPNVDRGGLTGTAVNGDDVNCYVAANSGTGIGTDCYYISRNGGFEKAVTGAVNNGSGLIRLTVTAHGLLTGRVVVVDSVGGVPNAKGAWTVTVVDANTLDLQGSTFAGTYTSGGTVYKPEWGQHWGIQGAAEYLLRTTGAYAEGGIDFSLARMFAPNAFAIRFANLQEFWGVKVNGTDQPLFRINASDRFELLADTELASGKFLLHNGIAGNPSSLAAGQHWYNTTQKSHRFYAAHGTAGLVGLVFSRTSDDALASGGTAELKFASQYAIPAAGLTVGKVIRVRIQGTYTTDATASQTMVVNVKLGDATNATSGTTVATTRFALTSSLTNANWSVDCDITIRSATTAWGAGFGTVGSTVAAPWTAAVTSVSNGGGVGTVTTIPNISGAQTLHVTGTPNDTGMTITLRNMTIEVSD